MCAKPASPLGEKHIFENQSVKLGLYHYQDYDGDDFDAVIQTPDDGWSAFEVKLDSSQIDEAAASLVRIASKFRHNPPTSLGVVVGKSGVAYRRREDGVYVLPITSLKP